MQILFHTADLPLVWRKFFDRFVSCRLSRNFQQVKRVTQYVTLLFMKITNVVKIPINVVGNKICIQEAKPVQNRVLRAVHKWTNTCSDVQIDKKPPQNNRQLRRRGKTERVTRRTYGALCKRIRQKTP